MLNLSTKYLGLELKNPIIIGSSGLTDSVEKIIEIEKSGAGAVVLKSLFEEEIVYEMEEGSHSMTGRAVMYPETFDYMDEFPEEDSVRKYLRLIRESKAAVKIPIIASINCVSAQKWTYFANEIEKAGADALELNAFILPSDMNRTGEENEQVYFDIIEEVKKHTKLPISLKISYYFSNLAQMIQKLSETGIAGLTLFNRFYSPDFDLENLQVSPSFILSHPNDLPISLRWVGIVAERISCDIAASTGVHNGDAAIKQILAGANAVQVVSAIYKNGNTYIKTILNQIEAFMKEHEYTNIADFKGKLSQSKALDPAAYERVQFMKHFRSYQG
jgi:dihydroorotate dehydrogenase (fumarate)